MNNNINNGWAWDLDNSMLTNAEIRDVDVINRSIENILTTNYGERLFNLNFGAGLNSRIFENITPAFAEGVLNEVAGALKVWETRITVLESQMRLIRNTDENSIIIIVPYIVNSNNITSIFKKKLSGF
jgi:phage baseplate assembly protein W